MTSQQKYRLLFAFFFLAFLGLRLVNIAPRISDENYYFYAAHLMTKGVLPYRDYFFQHFPAQIMLYALLIKFVGVNIAVLKLVHILATCGTAYLLYRLLSDMDRTKVGVLAAGLMLGSFATLGTTDYAFGVHGAVFLLTLSWYLSRRSPILGGLVLFLGLTYRIYILPAAVGLILYEFLRGNRRRAWRFLLAAWLPFMLLNLVLLAAFGERFLTPIWRYHILKLSMPTVEDELSFPLFLRNDVVVLMFATAAVWLLLRKTLVRRKSKARMPGTSSVTDLGLAASGALVAQLSFLLALSIVFQFYFMTLLPFLAVLAALALGEFLPTRSRKYAIPLVISLALINGFFYQKEVSSIGTFEHWDEVTRDVTTIAGEEDTIFGSYVVTTMVALMSQREITDYQIDTNFQRNLTGLFSSDQATQVATKSAVLIQKVSVDEAGQTESREPFYLYQDVIEENCQLYRQYPAEKGFMFNAIVLWDCTRGT